MDNSHAVKFTFTQPRVFLNKKKNSIQLPVKFLPFYLSFLWVTLHVAKKTKYCKNYLSLPAGGGKHDPG